MLTRTRFLSILGAVSLLAVFAIRLTAKPKPGTQAKHQRYQVTVLPRDGGADSFEAGYLFYAPLTNRGTMGVAADTSTPGGPPFNSYIWTNNKQVDLQPLPQSPNLMGTSTYINWINEFNFSAGYGTRFDSTTQTSLDHAAAWTPDGQVIPLSTPEGYQSHAVWINDFGLVSGWIDNGVADPCSFGVGGQTLGVVWEFGVRRPLGTLGGMQSYGEFNNDLGQVSGHSETTLPSDNPCPDYDAFIWQNGKMTDITPGNFGGSEGGTNFLNNQGDAVGFGTTPMEAGFNAFLYSRGNLTNLSNIGSFGNNADSGYNVNELGHVVGVSGTSTGGFLAVLWRGQEFINLMSFTAYGEDCSQLVRINSRDQIVGSSYNCETFTSHAALWENNELVDLNTLIPSDSGVMLTSAGWINEDGVIAAQGVLTSGPNSGAFRAVLLFPNGDCDESKLVTSSSPAQEGAKAQRSNPYYRTADGRVNPMFERPFSVEMMRRKAQN